jgi:hypothetical protein
MLLFPAFLCSLGKVAKLPDFQVKTLSKQLFFAEFFHLCESFLPAQYFINSSQEKSFLID